MPEGAKAIRVPKTVDCLQGLINVVPLQLLSYRTSLSEYYLGLCYKHPSTAQSRH